MARPSDRSTLMACLSRRNRRSMVAGVAMAAHWNGVCGFGTKPPIETVHRMSRDPVAARPALITSWASRAICTTSSSVSVGRPHMKYSFTCRHPLVYAVTTVRIRSSSVTILLMTRRIRSDPPSGANVSPVRRPPRDSSSASVMLNASTRVDGSDSDTFSPSYWSARPEQMSPISEWSALDSDSSPTSEKPENASPSRTMSPIVVIDRSRTGRVIIFALQNRQPRVQPRKISTAYRSCTVSASGTSGLRRVGRGNQVRVDHIGGEQDAEQVERAHRPVRVDGDLRDAVLAHEPFQVGPDRVGALGQHVGPLVEDLVQDLHALVGPADLVRVRVHERPPDGRGVP